MCNFKSKAEWKNCTTGTSFERDAEVEIFYEYTSATDFIPSESHSIPTPTEISVKHLMLI